MLDPATLGTLSPAAAARLAEHYRSIADQLDAHAARQADKVRQSAARRATLKSVLDAGRTAARVAVETGRDLETVAAELAERRGLDPAAVAQVARCRVKSGRAARDRLARQLADQGKSNAEIGRRLNLHPVTVSRILNGKAAR